MDSLQPEPERDSLCACTLCFLRSVASVNIQTGIGPDSTLDQLPAKALSSNRHGHRKRSHMQPSSPSISEQTAQYLAFFILEKESDRVPFAL
jgi:hypothetical protein